MRRPKPWYRMSKSAWYVQHNGQQVRLGEHPEGAAPPKKTKSGWNAPPAIIDAFYKLMASDPSGVPDAEELITAQVCDLFLDHSERHNERSTDLCYKHFLQNFCALHGRTKATELKPIHVTRWLDANTWKGGRRDAVAAVKRAFNWADQQGLLSPNPLRNVQKPAGAFAVDLPLPGASVSPIGWSRATTRTRGQQISRWNETTCTSSHFTTKSGCAIRDVQLAREERHGHTQKEATRSNRT